MLFLHIVSLVSRTYSWSVRVCMGGWNQRSCVLAEGEHRASPAPLLLPDSSEARSRQLKQARIELECRYYIKMTILIHSLVLDTNIMKRSVLHSSDWLQKKKQQQTPPPTP